MLFDYYHMCLRPRLGFGFIFTITMLSLLVSNNLAVFRKMAKYLCRRRLKLAAKEDMALIYLKKYGP